MWLPGTDVVCVLACVACVALERGQGRRGQRGFMGSRSPYARKKGGGAYLPFWHRAIAVVN